MKIETVLMSVIMFSVGMVLVVLGLYLLFVNVLIDFNNMLTGLIFVVLGFGCMVCGIEFGNKKHEQKQKGEKE